MHSYHTRQWSSDQFDDNSTNIFDSSIITEPSYKIYDSTISQNEKFWEMERPTVSYQIFQSGSSDFEEPHHLKTENYSCAELTNPVTPYVRVVKKRNTANKKERRRTQSINNAYADLRDCIPSVPADTKLSKINNAYASLRLCIPSVAPDTKLSKIKTLRLATSYISYLKGVLDGEKPPGQGFCAEIENLGNRLHHLTGGNKFVRRKSKDEMKKGRTGWPEHVWELEFKQEQNL